MTRDAVPLSTATLADLPKAVLRPKYDRAAVSPGIVHIGVGNFHRAHQAWYLHRLMQQGLALDWGIIGAGVRPFDKAQRDALLRQDGLFSLIELDPEGQKAEVVGALIGYCPVEPENQALIKLLADPRVRIVSLTVTEGGYFLDPATKHFAPEAPDASAIQQDAAAITTPRPTPHTAFGAIVAALQIRRAAGIGPFTCLSCDNLPGNGAILREVVTGLAQLADPDLAKWITDRVSFPNSMVDCIVPATGARERDLAAAHGIRDAAPVTHERFRQWVMEDDFCAGRPPWEEVGATFTTHVHGYEMMKLRILNGGHQIIASPAETLGLATISEAMQQPEILQFFCKTATQEIAPHIGDVPGMTPARYIRLIEQRFANPAIVDTVRRVAFDGSARHTGAVLPVIREAIARGAPLDGLALSQALWARMCAGTREDGSQIEANDPHWADLVIAAKGARAKPQIWLEQRQFYGAIADDARFAQSFATWLRRLYAEGVRATLAGFVNS